MSKVLHADYLIVGAGASGMAFADTIVEESSRTIIIVDKEHKPGGHWNHAYSFVTLHQPSSFYGVGSKELSRGAIDSVGLNAGLHELASGAEVSAYYDQLMREVLLPSGQVHYFPMSEYLGDGQIRSLLTSEIITVSFDTLVDATYYKTSVPATHTPAFTVNDNLQVIPPNHLPLLTAAIEGITVIGGGKTAIDTCLWLLQHGVSADAIMWIMPRDAWFIDRKNTQPSKAFFFDTIGAQAAQLECVAQSTSLEDMFLRLEKSGVFLRLDPNVVPSMFHGATISKQELEEIRRIKQVVRLGRVISLDEGEITFEHGSRPLPANQVLVDCTASAITNLTRVPVFAEHRITLQTVRAYQPTFSAAFIAHIDLTYSDQDKKNRLCTVVRLPNHDYEWVDLTYQNMMNQYFWSKEPGLKKWLHNHRLDGFMRMVANVKFYELKHLRVLNRMRKAAKPAIAKLKHYKKALETAGLT